jgi:hypothetical protein
MRHSVSLCDENNVVLKNAETGRDVRILNPNIVNGCLR